MLVVALLTMVGLNINGFVIGCKNVRVIVDVVNFVQRDYVVLKKKITLEQDMSLYHNVVFCI